MVACRGHIDGDEVRLVQSKPYLSIGSGSPVWMGGASDEKSGELFAFIAKDAPGQARILTLTGDKPSTKEGGKINPRKRLGP